MVDTIHIPCKKNTLMIAHRGLSSIERENSLPAFVAACNRSYFGIETDVHPTADGRLVVIHDSSTARVAFGERVIEETTFEELRGVKLRDMDDAERQDLSIPLYSEYLKLCRKYGKTTVVELKNAFAPETISDFIAATGTVDDVIFISFCTDNLAALRSKLPQARLQLLTGDFDDNVKAFLKDNKADLDIYYPALFTGDAGEVDRSKLEWLRREGKTVNVWTVDDASAAAKLIDAGVDMITTNCLE